MKRTQWLSLLILVTLLFSIGVYVRATCTPNDTGTAGNDTIDCTVTNSPSAIVQGQDGDDVIIIDSGVTVNFDVSGGNTSAVAESGNDIIVNNGNSNSTIYGDSISGVGSGSDTIVNNGAVVGALYGDSVFNTGSGNDTIINNGSTDSSIYGDSANSTGNGSDTITNNGTVAVNIYGDTLLGNGSGDDTIINNGVIGNNIYGDTNSGNGSGNDTIINNGVIGSDLLGDTAVGAGTGNDTITNNGTVNNDILAGGGIDLVIIGANTAQVGGTIDGGAGYDTLTFSITSSDPAVLLDAAQRIAAANPAGGTITLGGHTYTWLNFEELTQLLFSLARLNGLMDPVAVFCSLYGGIDVYNISGQQGIFSLHVSTQTISNGLAQVVDSRLQIGASSTSSAYILPTGEVEVSATNGFHFSFIYQTYCGALPTPNGEHAATAEAEEELPEYTIINQPYGG